ncbi:PEPxxWA-CTERM sorting domain-containing protein [Glacieibacterium frigidum]|nr:PEPxxWA-CTERM sorting domain-containing protein [Glacieibacterium frigidum]
MMLRSLLTVLALAAAVPLHAGVLTEDFGSPYAGWETRWFAQNSNATRVFFDPNDRGNNVTGLTVFDGNPFDGGQVRILFDADFARTIRNFSFDILGYNQQTLDVFDIDGNSLLNVVITPVAGPPYDFAQSGYTRFSVDSTNGIGGFSLLPFGAEYNYSIDNLAATVPEPASWALMIGGFGLVGAALRRRRGASALA